MINLYAGKNIKDANLQTMGNVKSIILTTDTGNIILAPCKDAVVSLTTTETYGALDYLVKKEATIELEYDNMIIIK